MNIDKKLVEKLDAVIRGALESEEVSAAVEQICEQAGCSASVEVMVGFHRIKSGRSSYAEPRKRKTTLKNKTSDVEFVKFMKSIGGDL